MDEVVVYGYNLVNPGPNSNYQESYGSFAGSGGSYYNNNYGQAFDTLAEWLKNPYFQGANFIYNTYSESNKSNFNAQLGRIMAEGNYPSGQPFYIQDLGGGYHNIYTYDNQFLGQINVWHK